MRVGILTVSTSKCKDPTSDKSGATLVQLFQQSDVLKDVVISHTTVVMDDMQRIVSYLESWGIVCDVIITTGGTGLSFDDVTPEATKRVIKKECPGIVLALLNRSLQATPMAALTRLAAGVYKKCLIVNFPGSPKACTECFEVMEPILNHAVALLVNQVEQVAQDHKAIQSGASSAMDISGGGAGCSTTDDAEGGEHGPVTGKNDGIGRIADGLKHTEPGACGDETGIFKSTGHSNQERLEQ